MKCRTILYTVPMLFVLVASGCRSLGQTGPVTQPAAGVSRQTHGQIVAGIHAMTEALEAEILMRFVHTPDQEFFNNVMGILGRTFAELPRLAPPTHLKMCPEGTTHMCSQCWGYPAGPCPQIGWPRLTPPADQVPLAQTPVQMIAGIQAAIRLLDAEIQTRFVHTPNQQLFNEVMKILGRAFEELPGLFPEGAGTRCPEGTVHVNSMCMGENVFNALRIRRP